MARTPRPARGFVHEPGWESNEDYEWYTPPFIFEHLNVEFDLDPCSPGRDKCIVPAKTHYTLPTNNGLIDPWFGLVFCNPPYGRYVDKWLNRCVEHNNGIALIFSRTSTKWFQSTAPTTSAICFINKRLRFISGKTGELGDSAGADSMLMAWGDKAKDILIKSNIGMVVKVND